MSERRQAVVTGATSGIGLAIAMRLARSHDVYLLGRGDAALEAAKREVETLGGNAFPLRADLRSSAEIDAAFEALTRRTPLLHVLVNNAGVSIPDDLQSDDTSACDELISVNLLSVFACTHRALPLLRRAGRADIINISSMAAVEPISSQPVYSGTKAGMQTFGKALRQELQGSGIRVSNILPGSTASKILRHFSPGYIAANRVDEELRMEASTVANAVAFILEQPEETHIPELQVAPVPRRK